MPEVSSGSASVRRASCMVRRCQCTPIQAMDLRKLI
jgi:hypothetical protein